jgi:hypothetical protein
MNWLTADLILLSCPFFVPSFFYQDGASQNVPLQMKEEKIDSIYSALRLFNRVRL